MRGLHVNVAIMRARLDQQAAQLDHLPGQRVPVSPNLLGLMHEDAAQDLRHGTKNLRHAGRQSGVTQNIPF